jgi:hypothetical protein
MRAHQRGLQRTQLGPGADGAKRTQHRPSRLRLQLGVLFLALCLLAVALCVRSLGAGNVAWLPAADGELEGDGQQLGGGGGSVGAPEQRLADLVARRFPLNRLQCGSGWQQHYAQLHRETLAGRRAQRFAIFRSLPQFQNGKPRTRAGGLGRLT